MAAGTNSQVTQDLEEYFQNAFTPSGGPLNLPWMPAQGPSFLQEECRARPT